MKPSLKSLFASLALGALSATSADAAVIVTFPTPSLPGSIVFTNDINFTITTGGDVRGVAFDEWVTNSTNTSSILGASISPNLSYSLNGGATATLGFAQFTASYANSSGALTPNDGYLYGLTSVTTTAGDVFTLKAATYTLAAGSLPVDFNPQAAQTFTGNAFLFAAVTADRRSANTPVGGAVPEPSHALLLLGGLSTLVFRRRK
jgi:hypothetical protein